MRRYISTTSHSRKSTEEFVSQARIVHGDIYDYSLSDYTGAKYKIIILCKIHGQFLQEAGVHLAGCGCPECKSADAAKRNLSSISEFTNKANAVHNGVYDYSDSIYTLATNKINIKCRIHGEFYQIASNHLRGHGCPRCSSSISKIATKWLDSLNIDSLIREYTFPEWINKKKRADGYDPLTNTVYQFHGDFWHGNPESPRFDVNDVNPRTNCTYLELYRATCESDDWIRSQGYNLVVMWSNDFNL